MTMVTMKLADAYPGLQKMLDEKDAAIAAKDAEIKSLMDAIPAREAEHERDQARITDLDAALRGVIADMNVLAEWIRAKNKTDIFYWLERMPEHPETDPAKIDIKPWLSGDETT
jgi:hypothetical protein